MRVLPESSGEGRETLPLSQGLCPVYALDGAIAGKVTFCGYLCADEEDPAKAPMREELRRATDKLVVVTAGGGGGGYDAYPMMPSGSSARIFSLKPS